MTQPSRQGTAPQRRNLFDWSGYPYIDSHFDADGELVCREITRMTVAANCMARVFYFGLRDPADPFVHGELDLALHLGGVADLEPVA